MNLQSLGFGFSVALLFAGFFPCRGQQSTGPATLADLMKADADAEAAAGQPASADPDEPAAEHSGPARPAGTLVRPKDGVQHPDLDKTWAEYDAAIATAGEGIRAAISKQFDAATAEGDLDNAEKWQAVGEDFDKAGELPAGTETKAAVRSATAEFKKAADGLAKAYEAVVKTLTMEKRIADAKAVRQEWSDVLAIAGQKHGEDGSSIRDGEGGRPAQLRRRKWTLVLWNTHNSRWRDRGTRTCDITAEFNGKAVFEKKGLEVPWFRDRDANVAVEILSPGIDSLRVSITAWNGPGSGGLAEIQLFDDRGQNIAPTFEIEASAAGGEGAPRVLLDGDTAAGSNSRWCLPNGTLGWVEIRRPRK